MRNIVVLVVIISLFLAGCQRTDTDEIILSSVESEKVDDKAPSEPVEVPDTNETVVIFVCGAVADPGVYTLEEDKRIIDAVEAAGGFSENADESYLNLAATLQDGMKLQIPTQDETASLEDFNSSFSKSESENTLVNINSASKEELKSLPGIGDGIAGKIIDYRTEKGRFTCIEDVMKVSGIKDKLFAKIKDYITV